MATWLASSRLAVSPAARPSCLRSLPLFFGPSFLSSQQFSPPTTCCSLYCTAGCLPAACRLPAAPTGSWPRFEPGSKTLAGRRAKWAERQEGEHSVHREMLHSLGCLQMHCQALGSTWLHWARLWPALHRPRGVASSRRDQFIQPRRASQILGGSKGAARGEEKIFVF